METKKTHGGARAGAGRKAGSVKDDSKKSCIQLRVSDEQKTAIKKAAEAAGLSVTEYILSKCI